MHISQEKYKSTKIAQNPEQPVNLKEIYDRVQKKKKTENTPTDNEIQWFHNDEFTKEQNKK